MMIIHIVDRISQSNQATEALSFMRTKVGGNKQQFCNISNQIWLRHHLIRLRVVNVKDNWFWGKNTAKWKSFKITWNIWLKCYFHLSCWLTIYLGKIYIITRISSSYKFRIYFTIIRHFDKKKHFVVSVYNTYYHRHYNQEESIIITINRFNLRVHM